MFIYNIWLGLSYEFDVTLMRGGHRSFAINLHAAHDIFDFIHIGENSWDFGYVLDPYPNSKNVDFSLWIANVK